MLELVGLTGYKSRVNDISLAYAECFLFVFCYLSLSRLCFGGLVMWGGDLPTERVRWPRFRVPTVHCWSFSIITIVIIIKIYDIKDDIFELQISIKFDFLRVVSTINEVWCYTIYFLFVTAGKICIARSIQLVSKYHILFSTESAPLNLLWLFKYFKEIYTTVAFRITVMNKI